MAVSIQIKDGDLIVRIRGVDKVRALRGSLTVPLAHVARVRAHPDEAWFDHAIVDAASGLGVYIPGRLAVGTVELVDGPSFFDVHDPKKAIAIDLQHEDLHHLVLELADETPEEAVLRIERGFESRTLPALVRP